MASLPGVAGSVVTIAVVAFVVGAGLGWLGGWWRLRRVGQARRTEREAERAAHERRVAGLRTELVAAAAARALTDRARAARDVGATGPTGTDTATDADITGLEADLHAAEQELQVLRDQQAMLDPLAEEIEVTRRYVETLHRELVYRDEQLIQLQTGPHLDLTLAPPPVDSPAERASVRQRGHDGIEQPSVKEVLEGDSGHR